MSENQDDLQQRIAAYIDGELPPAEAARLEVYLANTDPALADSVVGMLADKVQIRAIPRTRAPADLSSRIMEQIERSSLLHEDDSAPKRPWFHSRAAIAAGLAIVLGGFTYFVANSVRRPAPDNPYALGGSNSTGPAGPVALVGPAGRDQSKIDGRSEGAHGSDTPGSRAPSLSKDGGVAESDGTKQGTGSLTLGGPLAQGPSAAPMITPFAAATTPSVTPSPILPGAPATLAASPADLNVNNTMTQMADASRPPSDNVTPISPEGTPIGPIAMGGAGGGGGGRGAPAGARAGGGGGFGGGAGGGPRGGAVAGGGRGAATPGAASPALIAPAVTGINTLAPSADNTLLALAAITREGKGPLVLTFLARDDQDFARLTAALAALSNANTLNLTNTQSPIPAQNDPRSGVQPQTTGQAQPSPQTPDANTKVSATITLGITNEGIVTFDSPPTLGLIGNSLRFNNTVNFANGTNGANSVITNNGQIQSQTQTNFYNPDNLYNDQKLAGSQYGNTEVARSNANTLQNLQLATARGGPYRIALRTEQLAELSKSYRLTLVARGDVVYQFRILGDQSPRTAGALERQLLLQKAGLDQPEARAADKNQSAAAASAPAPLVSGGALNANGNVTTNVAGTNYTGGNAITITNGTTLTVGNSITPDNAGYPKVGPGTGALPNSPLLDCLITMEPAPATPAPANGQ